MKFKNLAKKIAAYLCVGAMVISSMAGAGTITARADGEVAEDVELTAMTGVLGASGKDYTYKFASLDGYHAGYKYMIITYQGNIKGVRYEFSNVVDDADVEKTDLLWIDQEQAVHMTLAGTPDLDTTESSSVIVDLEASGIDLGKYNSVHMHITDIIAIGTVRLSNTAEVKDTDVTAVLPEPEEPGPSVDPTTLEPITLNDAEKPFIRVWSTEATEGYAYLGEVAVNAPAAGYKYLMMTYKGDATAFDDLRLEFPANKTLGFVNAYDGQLVTVDGTAVPAPTEEEQTVVIDLEASGLDLTKTIESFHVHTTGGNGSFEITDAQLLPPEKPAELTPITLNDTEKPLIRVWSTEATEGYAYLGEVAVNAPAAGYKYLMMTYKGDATAFDDLRLEFPANKTLGFVNAYDGQLVTVDGTAVPAPTEEEQTVVIDLEASGLDITKKIENFHVHTTGGNGSFEVTDAQLLAEYKAPVDPSTLEDIILNGDEQGMSSMIKKFATIKAVDTGKIQYKYLGFATLKEPTSDYKYLILTYTGDISTLRFEFANVQNETELAKTQPYWFNKEGQTSYFVTADESDIPLDGGKGTTVVIDLEKTGIDLAQYNSVYMHAGYGDADSKDIDIQIGMARLSTSAEIKSVDVMPAEQPSTEKPTVQTPTTTGGAAEVKAPGKAKIKKVAAKKKSAKKVKLTLKKVANAKGYQVQFSTTKKFKKVLVKKNVKKLKVTVTSKKLKNKKKLYVRVAAYNLNGKTKVFGSYSKVKKVKVKG